MRQLHLKATLLSDATFGNGTAVLFGVHTEVETDKNGWPYLKAKTLKGCLRRVMKDYGICDEKTLSRYFGAEGTQSGRSNKGAVFFEDLTIDLETQRCLNPIKTRLENAVDETYPLKEAVRNTFTAVRRSIRVEDGLAQDHSLRAERVILKGTTLETRVRLSDTLSDVDIEKLELGFRALRHLGSKKNRGRGQIAFEITGREDGDSNDGGNRVQHDGKTLHVVLTAEQNIKLSRSFNGYDYESSKHYLTGSALRGAVINSLTQQNVDTGTVERFLKTFKFSNAYLYQAVDGTPRPFAPIPLCFYGEKKHKRAYDIEGIVSIKMADVLAYHFEERDDEDGTYEKRLLDNKFAFIDDGKCHAATVKTGEALHHASPVADAETFTRENLFRYEFIEKGQRFYGTVDLGDASEEEVQQLVDILTEPLYIGGSVTSGYGRCSVSFEQAPENASKAPTAPGYVTVMAYSDVSAEGVETLKEELESDFGLAFKGAFLQPEWVTGFNHHIGGLLPVEKYAQKGSVFVFTASKSLDVDALASHLEGRFYGKRTEEGFGVFRFVPQITEVNEIVKFKEKPSDKAAPSIPNDHVFTEVEERFLYESISLWLDTYYDYTMASGTNVNSLSKSAIGSIQSFIYKSYAEQNTLDACLTELYESARVIEEASTLDERQHKAFKIGDLQLFSSDALPWASSSIGDVCLKEVSQSSDALKEAIIQAVNEAFLEEWLRKNHRVMEKIVYTHLYKVMTFKRISTTERSSDVSE